MDLTGIKFTNSLIDQTSPYLLQHAHNPVNWYPWDEHVFEQARKEDKLVLISIGYSACHWCHVMEHESFEDEEVAKIMNDHFFCIKVDREERPDVDQVYMSAVQIMKGAGGWPLNCFVLPDGRPIYGGTYFPKQQWMNVLLNLVDLYKTDKERVLEYASRLTDGIRQLDLIQNVNGEPQFSLETLKETFVNWSGYFDYEEGGPNRAPKFPLPNNYQFLLYYYHITKDKKALEPVILTLDKMAFGGIYDQLGGGFSRYSTDAHWKVPHFEKMLYDNAQLVSLYSEAYQATRKPLYKQVVYETLAFIEREMTSPEGAFYSALDADSEGEEGKFYVWTKGELQRILSDKFRFAEVYFNVNDVGYWENDNYILLRKKRDEEIAAEFGISMEQLGAEMEIIKKQLFSAREKRIRPGLDDKSLTSWNALMLKAYADAYNTFGKAHFIEAALKNAYFILTKLRRTDGGLYHNYKEGKTTINGYLEDYAFTIEAFIALYTALADEKWLNLAKELVAYALTHFYDKKSGMFYFTSDLDKELIARKMELSDNVIPASNSSMAKSLFVLGHYFDEAAYNNMAARMLHNIQGELPKYGSGYSNWGILLLNFVSPFYEIAITGEEYHEKMKLLQANYFPNRIIMGTKRDSTLPLLKNKYIEGKTMIYVCVNKTCKLPVEGVEAAMEQMNLSS